MYTVALTIPSLSGIYFVDVLYALQSQAKALGVRLIVMRTGFSPQNMPPFAADHADAWLLIINSVSPEFCNELLSAGKPLVSLAYEYADSRIPVVRCANRLGIHAGMQALFDAGHRHFAFLGPVTDFDTRERLAAFHEFLAEHQLSAPEGAVCQCETHSVSAGQHAASALLHLPTRPTAVITSTDPSAAGALACFVQAGLNVPDDIAIIGFDNSPLAESVSPPLASIDQNLAVMAHAALTTLLNRLQGGPASGKYIPIPPSLIVRASAGLATPQPAMLPPQWESMHEQFTKLMLSNYEFLPFLHNGTLAEVPNLLHSLTGTTRWVVFAQPDGTGNRLIMRHVFGPAHSVTEAIGLVQKLGQFPPLDGFDGVAFVPGDYILTLPLWLDDHSLSGIIALYIPQTDTTQSMAMLMLCRRLELLAVGLERVIQAERLHDLVAERTAEIRTAYEELKTFTKQLKDTERQLFLQEKMASLGTLTAGVAHEINNPTNFVHVAAQNQRASLTEFEQYVTNLLDDGVDPTIVDGFKRRFTELQTNVSTMLSGTLRIKRIVKDLSSFTRQSTAEKQFIHLSECLNATLSLVRASWMEKVEFITEYTVDPLYHCWPGLLNQVFMNLMVNACQAIAERHQHVKGHLWLRLRSEPAALVVEIADDGIGIEPAVREHILEPFFTTKEVGHGTGLGLSISYGIIQQHNATLSISSTPGQGSCFSIHFPLEGAAA